MRRPSSRFVLRNARRFDDPGAGPMDVVVASGRVEAVRPPGPPGADRAVDLAGAVLLPGLVNAHDHLDHSTLPPLAPGRYAGAGEWAAAMERARDDGALEGALAVPLTDRLFLGGLRNLLAGVTAVAHHGPFHRSLSRDDFPVRVLERYQFAQSPALTQPLRRTYRTTDRRIPWLIHLAEGTDERSRGELEALVRENVLRQNTVLIHAIGLPVERMAAVAAANACVVWCPEANRRLYGATADVAALRAAGVRVGLGSDSPASGVRDALSNLAAARAEGVFTDAELLTLATTGSAEVARLPAGALQPGAVADLIGVESLDRLLAGERAAVALALVGGRARYGREDLMAALEPASVPLAVDGRARRLDAESGRRMATLLRRDAGSLRGEWTAGLQAAATVR